jgi:colicin import membrane protein
MKKILALLIVALGIIAQPAFAQKKTDKKETTVTKKNGTPDMRYKQNKMAAEKKTKEAKTSEKTVNKTVSNSKPTQTVTTTKTTTTTASQGVNKSSDKAIGTDSKGRTIYEGPRGGHYYVDSKGNKVYVKKS